MQKDKLTFEQLLSELEIISKKLESQEITLEESIALYEKGMKISKNCSKMLENAKQRIEKISDDGENPND